MTHANRTSPPRTPHNTKAKTCAFALLLLLAGLLPAKAQNTAYLAYINTYKDLAVEQMNKYGVPASITLAQGLLESGAGRSELVRKSNNHFGIKCGGTWTGPYVLKDDDARNERFRAYKSARESYEDHSLFLRNRSRYAFLFRYSPTDYKAWAHGLKKAGYATNPRYAHQLISLIQRYDLDRFDKLRGKATRPAAVAHGQIAVPGIDLTPSVHLTVRMNNDNYYVIARPGDTYESIGEQMGVSTRKLRKYNEVPRDYELQAGDIVYFEKKQKKADKAYKGKYHRVAAGESVYVIAQKYGIRLKTLYDNNDLPKDYSPQAGQLLKVR